VILNYLYDIMLTMKFLLHLNYIEYNICTIFYKFLKRKKILNTVEILNVFKFYFGDKNYKISININIFNFLYSF